MQREVSFVYTSIRIAKGQKIKLRFVRLWSDLNYCVTMHSVEGKHWIVHSLTTLGNGLVAYWLHFITVTRIPGKDYSRSESIILLTASKGLFHRGKKGTAGQSCVAHVELDEVLCWLSPPTSSRLGLQQMGWSPSTS